MIAVTEPLSTPAATGLAPWPPAPCARLRAAPAGAEQAERGRRDPPKSRSSPSAAFQSRSTRVAAPGALASGLLHARARAIVQSLPRAPSRVDFCTRGRSSSRCSPAPSRVDFLLAQLERGPV